MATIKAPYNFVPLNEKVFFPDWADKISQDVPFEDGVSGTIELKITAQTPIFVRNGHEKSDADAKNDEYKSFSKTVDNRYFIPATSIKGAIRNVLEIMSFGKMTQVENASFGLRDLNNTEYRNQMRNICCGWLQQCGDGFQLYDWGIPGRISVEAIDKKYNTNLENFVKGDNFKDDANKTAKYKYMLSNAESSCKTDKFCKDEDLQKMKAKINPVEPRVFYKFGGDEEGVLVFTGQPSQRKKIYDKKTRKEKWTGKYYEFVFLKPKIETPIILSDDLVRAFKTIHADSPDYKDFWAKKLNAGEKVPVFFKKNGDKVHSIGLAYMYKYPFKQSVHDAIPKELCAASEKLDLAECMFGYISKNNALRGRIQFSHAFATGQPTPLTDKVFVSGTPHPSFYPLYVKGGNDWNFARQIAGRKRYPIRNQANYSNEGTANMTQICSMLNKGVVFTETIFFHNLRKFELGALLSALTFHGMSNKCFHNLGFGKPYGYGKIKISELKLNYIDEPISSYMKCYEDIMGDFVGKNESLRKNDSPFAKLSDQSSNNPWLSSTQLQELVTMAAGIPDGMDKKFQYLKLSTNRDANEFLRVKKDRESLNLFSEIINKTVTVDKMEEDITICDKTCQGAQIIEETMEIIPTDLKIDIVVPAHCIKNKIVRLEDSGYDIQLVVPKIVDSTSLINKHIKVRIKQISKTGKICQVEYVE